MQTVLHQLYWLYVDSIPTVVIFLLLHWYLRRVLYRPLERTLAERNKRTEGQFEMARQQIALAEEKLTQYEQSIRAAHAATYRSIEERRRAALAERQRILDAARDRAEASRQAAAGELARTTAQARSTLASQAEDLAGEILHAVLGAKTMPQPGAGV